MEENENENKNLKARYNLAVMHFNGEINGERDLVKAFDFARTAYEEGLEEAMELIEKIDNDRVLIKYELAEEDEIEPAKILN